MPQQIKYNSSTHKRTLRFDVMDGIFGSVIIEFGQNEDYVIENGEVIKYNKKVPRATQQKIDAVDVRIEDLEKK